MRVLEELGGLHALPLAPVAERLLDLRSVASVVRLARTRKRVAPGGDIGQVEDESTEESGPTGAKATHGGGRVDEGAVPVRVDRVVSVHELTRSLVRRARGKNWPGPSGSEDPRGPGGQAAEERRGRGQRTCQRGGP